MGRTVRMKISHMAKGSDNEDNRVNRVKEDRVDHVGGEAVYSEG